MTFGKCFFIKERKKRRNEHWLDIRTIRLLALCNKNKILTKNTTFLFSFFSAYTFSQFHLFKLSADELSPVLPGNLGVLNYKKRNKLHNQVFFKFFFTFSVGKLIDGLMFMQINWYTSLDRRRRIRIHHNERIFYVSSFLNVFLQA